MQQVVPHVAGLQNLLQPTIPQYNLPQQRNNLVHPTAQQSFRKSAIQELNHFSLEQYRPFSAQQSRQSMQQRPQSVLRQQQQAVSIHEQQAPMMQESLFPTQQKLKAKHPNDTNMLQNQLTGQQNIVMQQEQQKLISQQKSFPHFREQWKLQPTRHPQNNLSSYHQHQLASQSNVNGLQQKEHLFGTQIQNSTMQTDQQSLISIRDKNSESAPGNGSSAAVGENLVAMTHRCLPHDGMTETKKMNRCISDIPLNAASSSGSASDSLKFSRPDTSNSKSIATSSMGKPRIQANQALLEDIPKINFGLMYTVLEVSEEDVDPSVAAQKSEGTILKCSFKVTCLNRYFQSLYASGIMSQIQPIRLFVPSTYPSCSFRLLEKLAIEVSKDEEDMWILAKARFVMSFRKLGEPLQLMGIVRAWDDCVRDVITEYGEKRWEAASGIS